MRAAITDTRLEAIAGPPVLVTRTPTVFEAGTAPHHVVVAGIPTGMPADGSNMIFAYSVDLTFNVQLLPTRMSWSGATGGTLGQAYWAINKNPVTGTIYLGRHQFQTHRDWQGPFMAAVYDRVLTDTEAQQVAQRLVGLL